MDLCKNMIWDRTKNIAIFSFIHLPVFKCILLSIQFIATASTVSFSQVPIQILLVEPVVTSPFQPNYCFQMSTPAAVVPHEQELSEHESVSSEVYDSGSGSGRDSFSHIQVACRVRPLSKKELALSKQTATPNSKHSKNCLRVDTPSQSSSPTRPRMKKRATSSTTAPTEPPHRKMCSRRLVWASLSDAWRATMALFSATVRPEPERYSELYSSATC